MSTLKIKLTSKRQATFPTETCEALGLKPGDTLELNSQLIDGQQVWTLTPAIPPDFSWVGMLKGKSTVTEHSMDKIRENIAIALAKTRP